jgi:hypothetical protein
MHEQYANKLMKLPI